MSDNEPRAAGPDAMKPATAAKKLGIYLPATPESFQSSALTRAQFAALQSDPPEWLVELRLNGPHPRDVVARKLGVSASGLARAEISDALTTAEISALLASPPQWLVRERATQAAVRAENARVKQVRADKAARTSD
jgi:sarcosine oxidase gamma subunit